MLFNGWNGSGHTRGALPFAGCTGSTGLRRLESQKFTHPDLSPELPSRDVRLSVTPSRHHKKRVRYESTGVDW